MNKRLWRMLAVVLSVVLVLSAFPLYSFVFAATYTVNNKSDWIKYVVPNASDSTVIINIGADFELDSDTESDFAGKIHGNGHVITVTTGTALFKQVSGTIDNLGVVSHIDDHGNRGYIGLFANIISGTISNCFAYGTMSLDFTDATINDVDPDVPYVGGFCGSVTEGSNVSDSFSCVSIQTTKASRVGGFAGIIRDSVTLSSCYSAGDIDADGGLVAGFANTAAREYPKTYSSCQIVNLSNDALPSGVNGLYDNQLSIMRESADNLGLKTTELMRVSQTELTDRFVMTPTAYPALKAFYHSPWSSNANAQDIVNVSIAAAAFSDVDSSARYEPSDMFARADYLTRNTYIDKTNVNSLSWSFDSNACKVYDTVPLTSYGYDSNATVGTSTDLLRSRFEFAGNVKNAVLKAETNGIFRQWHLSVDTQNIYYQQKNNGTSQKPFLINNKDQLNLVRHYCLNTAAYYKLNKDISSVVEFDPIVGFQGNFNGANHTISGVVLADDRKGDMGLFANTRSGSVIENLILANIVAVSETGKTSGALIGSAENTTVSKVLISTETDGATVGGIVGQMNGGSLKLSGVTGLVGQNGTCLGGLIGKTQGTVSVDNCYSTAVVLSDVASAVVGGLVGNVSSDSSVTNSYSAALADVTGTDAVAKPLFGTGTAKSNSGTVYDKQFYSDKTTAGGKTATELSTAFSSFTTNWTVDSSVGYPQLTVFSGKDLSALSTCYFMYQHYWEDADADNSTTGWIPNTFKTVESVEGVLKIYDVTSTVGHGFESDSGVRRVIVKAMDQDALCVRYAAAVRDDLIPLKYTVVGDSSLITDPRTYIELSHSLDGENWTTTQLMSVCDAQSKRLYDIPINSYIRVRVYTSDSYAVSSVKIGDVALNYSDAYYKSDGKFNTPVEVVITLDDNEALLWGLRRETY